MALLNILSRVAADMGLRINQAQEREYLIARINDVARVIWNNNELKNSEREQLFEFGQSDQQVALPYYIEKIIAARNYDTRIPVTQVDMRPRYMSNNWRLSYQGYPYFKWRLKGVSPIKQNMLSASPLTLSLPSANTTLFTAIVIGKTSGASRVQEVVTFSVGDISHTTTHVWEDIEAIRKSSPTDLDLFVTTTDDNIDLAQIPNTQVNSEYKILQALDRNEYPCESTLFEILYKPRFIPFINDNDQFQSGDIYDEVLYWKTLAMLYAKVDGKTELATSCNNTAENQMLMLAMNKDGPLDVKLKFGKNNVFQYFTNKGQSVSTLPTHRRLADVLQQY